MIRSLSATRKWRHATTNVAVVRHRTFIPVSAATVAISSYNGRCYSTSPNDMIASPQYYGSLQDAGGRKSRRPSVQEPDDDMMVPWQATDNHQVQSVTRKALIYEIVHQQSETIESIVPWFLDNMPSSYFKQVPEQFRIQHIKAISAIKDANMDLYLNLQAHIPDGRTVLTFIRPGTASGTLLKMVQELPASYSVPLSRLHVFSTHDQSLSLNMFIYGKSSIMKDKITTTQAISSSPEDAVRQLGQPILQVASDIQSGKYPNIEPNPLWDEMNIIKYMINNCTETYIRIGNEEPLRFLRQLLLVHSVSGTEGTAVQVTPSSVVSHGSTIDTAMHHHQHHTPTDTYWVDVAVSNSVPQVVLENLCHLLYLHNFDVIRARLDVIPEIRNSLNPHTSTTNNGINATEGGSSITMLRMLVSPIGSDTSLSDDHKPSLQETFETLVHEMKRAKWIDPLTHELVFSKYPFLGTTRGEVITGLCNVIHPVLAGQNPYLYSTTNIYDKICHPRFIHYASDIADLLLDRFRPNQPLSDADFQHRIDHIGSMIDTSVEDTMASVILHKMIHMVKHTLKTNVYMPDRYALAFRFDPICMTIDPSAADTATKSKPATTATSVEKPFGIVFVHGRRFNGFHVRFRDIARGGLRLVTPSTAEQYALESARHYDECFGLAYAQQLKNKDIPEGGSKAVALIQTYGLDDSVKSIVMRKSVKAMTDAILDLIVETDYTKKYMVDLWGRKEVLYLGPDEQVIPEDIEWIVRRAAERGYDTPAAFMSSKPRAGINHKEYGVTSEGVNVYLDVALRRVLKIDPKKDSFKIKLTGGPDGDVAGNEIKILIREYGSNAQIVGIADHSGCAEDPNGLDHTELLRLFHASLCISNFDSTKLGPGGIVHTVQTEEGVKARNSMHNRLDADAFLPCGGRPNTIDTTNYKQFFKADGKTPSAPLIVEGANLFVTADARKALFQDGGVIIVKDSSANKGGVITSSYEICSAMLLSETEFFNNKEQIVNEVLDKLRTFAQLEAELLFREFDSYDGMSLPEVSQVISHCINTTTDALCVALDSLQPEERDDLLTLFRAHLPKTIADVAFDRVHTNVPEQYIKNAIASCLASKLVYKEGTKFITCLPREQLAAIALKYIQKEKDILKMIETIHSSNMSCTEKEAVQRLLERGGARTALNL